MTETIERIEDLRALPAVSAVLARPRVAAMVAELGHHAVAQAVREAVAAARDEIRAGRIASLSERDIRRRATVLARRSLEPVLNATGIVVHTNLGRVPLADEAIEAMRAVASGYSTLEYDLVLGERGHRHAHLVDVLTALTGAEDALVVNNNAAAILLALTALRPSDPPGAAEVVVSRGELVEIGGRFRVPEVIAQSGARLREVGTTNRTHLSDYADAIGPDTAALLKVHRSNFEMVGFTSEVGVPELAELARSHGVPLVYDAGSGALPGVAELVGETPVSAMIAAGADVVTFSGDKLLGGPQAGIAVGRAKHAEAMRRSPLYRAMRPDKLTLAALGATLGLLRDAPERLPLVRMLTSSPEALEARCERIRAALASIPIDADVVPSVARVGGGAAPSREIESRAVRLRPPAPDELARALRMGEPRVIARIEDGAVLLDLLCVPEAEDERLAAAVVAATGPSA